MSEIAALLDSQMILTGLEGMYEREYRFVMRELDLPAKGLRNKLKELGLKDWRLDFWFPEVRLAVEVEGGGWVMGRHNRGAGFQSDLHKYHTVMAMGGDVYRCDGHLIKSGKAVNLIASLVSRRRDVS